jgi:hypothetical protein
MNEKQLREKISKEILSFNVPKPPTGEYANPMFEAMYNAQLNLQNQLASVVKIAEIK